MKRIKLSVVSMFASLVFAGNVFAGDASSSASAGANAGSTAVGIGQAAPNINVTEIGGTTIPASTHSTVDGTQTLKNVPNVYAPALTTTLTETCMGSSSGGFSIAGFGISAGGTWADEECVNRLNARELRSLGPDGALAAKEVMCANPVVREAYRKIGKPCIGDVASAAPAKTSGNGAQDTAPVKAGSNAVQNAELIHPMTQAVALNSPKYKEGDVIEFNGTRWKKQDESWLEIKN
jgi:hypothetical protein